MTLPPDKSRNGSAPLGADSRLPPPESVERAPVWLAEAIEWARGRRATDLHFHPSEGHAMFWARVDGDLREVARYSLGIHQRLMARLKVLGRCSDYAGDLVQEGRFALGAGDRAGEARFSILPTLRGEKAVVRLLADSAELARLDALGLSDRLRGKLRAAMDRPQGMLLAVGPSGCGKSTAIYALLGDAMERAGRPVSVVTVEDPIERSLPGAAQVAADPARGLGFAQCLRALLRQDPEIVMIGEIRDAATAETALQAALTGHRLLSSMHTQTAAEALVRLQQMGCEPYVVASALAGILNLRLARLLCGECATRRAPTADETARIAGLAAEAGVAEVGEPVGCARCMGGGHYGRTAVGEWSIPTRATADALATRATTAELAPTLDARATIREAATELLRAGRISMREFDALAGAFAGGRS